MTDWSKFKKFLQVGDKINDSVYGIGIISSVKPHEYYAYTVDFDNGYIQAFSAGDINEEDLISPENALEKWKDNLDEIIKDYADSKTIEMIITSAYNSEELTSEELQKLQLYGYEKLRKLVSKISKNAYYDSVQTYYHLQDDGETVNIAIPGFDTIEISLLQANQYIEQNWGNEYKLSDSQYEFSGLDSTETLFDSLIDWGIDINNSLTAELDFEITESEELQEFFDSLDSNSLEFEASKMAGTWAIPYNSEKAKELANIIKKFDEKEISKNLYDIFGNDELYDKIDSLQEQFVDVLKEYVEKLLNSYGKNPDSFKGQFDGESLGILREIINNDRQELEGPKKLLKMPKKKKKEYNLF